MAAEREGELGRREEALERREREIEARRKRVAERRMAVELRRRKIQIESDEVQALGNEEKGEFERVRAEIKRDMEMEEGERHNAEMRESRNATIEAEVETRRTKAERDRVAAALLQDEKDYQSKLDELSRAKKQLHQMREELKEEITVQDKELCLRFE